MLGTIQTIRWKLNGIGCAAAGTPVQAGSSGAPRDCQTALSALVNGMRPLKNVEKRCLPGLKRFWLDFILVLRTRPTPKSAMPRCPPRSARLSPGESLANPPRGMYDGHFYSHGGESLTVRGHLSETSDIGKGLPKVKSKPSRLESWLFKASSHPIGYHKRRVLRQIL